MAASSPRAVRREGVGGETPGEGIVGVSEAQLDNRKQTALSPRNVW